MYALARNSWKYLARDKRVHKVQNIEFNAYAPDTVEEIISAQTLLEKYTAKAWYNKEGIQNISEQELIIKGKELLSGDKLVVNDLEILAEGVEKGNRKVRIVKAYESYHAYGDMMIYYAVSNIMNYFSDHSGASFDTLESDLATNTPRQTQWLNLGGQLMKEDDFNTLVSDIKSGELTSWNDVHQRYNTLWQRYPLDKQIHSYQILCLLFGVDDLSAEQWRDIFIKAVDIQEYVSSQVYISRKKDYDNPFRKCTYRNDDEMISAIGNIDENKFIVQIKDETILFKQQVDEIISKLR